MKLLLTGVAALFLATGTGDQKVEQTAYVREQVADPEVGFYYMTCAFAGPYCLVNGKWKKVW